MDIVKLVYVQDTANYCRSRGITITVPTLAGDLNNARIRTNSGQPYQGGRGTYRLIAAVYHRLQQQGLLDDAENVALVFVSQTASMLGMTIEGVTAKNGAVRMATYGAIRFEHSASFKARILIL